MKLVYTFKKYMKIPGLYIYKKKRPNNLSGDFDHICAFQTFPPFRGLWP